MREKIHLGLKINTCPIWEQFERIQPTLGFIEKSLIRQVRNWMLDIDLVSEQWQVLSSSTFSLGQILFIWRLTGVWLRVKDWWNAQSQYKTFSKMSLAGWSTAGRLFTLHVSSLIPGILEQHYRWSPKTITTKMFCLVLPTARLARRKFTGKQA